MKTKIEISGLDYIFNTSEGIDLSIPVSHKESPIAFNAPPPEITPYQSGSFIGSLEEGSPVNFYNIKINPHGNATHTESARHIINEAPDIFQVLNRYHFIAALVTAHPVDDHMDGKKIDWTSCDWDKANWIDTEALIIRSNNGSLEEMYRNYTGKNPTYLDKDLAGWISERVDHLLVDIPSVDPEKDGGSLSAHRAFWIPNGKKAFHKTITELIFVHREVKDGMYLLELQTIPLRTDAVPSRPVIYPLRRV